MLTPYELEVALGFTQPFWEPRGVERPSGCSEALEPNEDQSSQSDLGSYPMDYYSSDGGPWNSSYRRKRATYPR
eukprot:9160459-Ditylum_brightwellii.AAC.1